MLEIETTPIHAVYVTGMYRCWYGFSHREISPGRDGAVMNIFFVILMGSSLTRKDEDVVCPKMARRTIVIINRLFLIVIEILSTLVKKCIERVPPMTEKALGEMAEKV